MKSHSAHSPHPHTPHAAGLPHRFDDGNPAAERGTRIVLWITLTMMAAEIVGGWWFNSMAVLADGWHMSSHAVAMGAAWLAYVLARRHADNPRFVWGTWKIEILASYTSAWLLIGVAVVMLWESVARLVSPLPIRYGESIALAVVGLVVNLLCAWILHGAGHHHHADHAHEHHDDHTHHDHDHAHHHAHDLNLRAAFVHVLADALTSALAIVALLGGSVFGWSWLDPAAGVIGAVMVAIWAVGLIRHAGAILLDHQGTDVLTQQIHRVLAEHVPDGSLSLADLHVWQVGRARYACVLHLETTDVTLQVAQVAEWLAGLPGLYHPSIQIASRSTTA
ncbi:MAG: CDF family Co(II)/Ni(II) efflux transporter DmeF [Rhodocyclaceae bacterium]